ncbi:MAG: RidA family protein [Proteobacteria bacterium]|nr:RidA family protein [Pseudomonadota bacterium]
MTAALVLAGTMAAGTAMAAAPTFHPRPTGNYPFAEAVQAGDMLYLSGILAEGSDGKVVAGGIEPESRQVMKLLGEVLARRGLGYDDLVQCTVLLADMKDWPAFNTIYRASFKPGHYPARAAMGVNGLALGGKVELQCNAWNPGRK